MQRLERGAVLGSLDVACAAHPRRRSPRPPGLTPGPIFRTLARMRSLLSLAFGLTLFCACASAGVEDAGSADAAVTIVDTGVRPDSGPAPDTGVLDAGPGDALLSDADPVVDATPGDAGPTTDALPGDATTTDALPGDSGPRIGPLTVIFEEHSGFGRSGVAMFHDGTGTLRATRTTTLGQIVEQVEEGWMVTITNTLESPSYLFTITEVAPSETYRIAAFTSPPELAVMTFAIGEPYPGAATYWYETGCARSLVSDPSELSPVSITEECTSPSGTIDYAVLARDANLNRLAFKLLEDVPVVANSTVTITSPWRTDFARIDITVSNAPTGADYVGLEAAVNSNGGEYDYDLDNLILSGGAGAFTLVRPPFGEGLNTRYVMNGPGGSSWLQKTGRAPVAQSYNLSTDFLPFPGPVTLSASPVVGRPTASWPAIAGLDFIELQALSFTQSVKWSVILRGDATSFLYPELPVELAAIAPTDLASFTTANRIIDADTVPDYAAARAAIGASVIDWPAHFAVQQQPLGAQVRGAGEAIDFD